MSILGLDDQKGHIASLIKLAKADGTVSEHEINLIKIIAIKMGISSSDFNEIVINVESINSLPPSSREEKEKYLYNLLTLLKIDLKTGEEELKIYEELGLRLGFGVDEVKKVGEFMSANLGRVVSYDEFQETLNS